MRRRIYKFETFEEMERQFHALLDEGVRKDRLTLYSPNPNHHFDALMDRKPSWVRLFTLIGALSGCIGGFLMCVWMSAVSWPIQTGNKGFITLPPFMVIMFELTILLGGLMTMAGFLFLARLPDPVRIISPEDFGNYFAIVVDEPEP
ncbi:MAG: hypothetical protein Kow0059_20290 [Candidatus Sumerlaeia bacterium]